MFSPNVLLMRRLFFPLHFSFNVFSFVFIIGFLMFCVCTMELDLLATFVGNEIFCNFVFLIFYSLIWNVQ